jgi:holliday junction DNA helicase RuvB
MSLDSQMTPNSFSAFVGQNRIKARLELAIAAAKLRNEALGHVLLVGSSGSGKATLAHIIANAMGVGIKSANGQVITNPSDLAGLLTNLEEGDVLFIDEIHQLKRAIGEYLRLAAREYKLDVIIDQGSDARSVRLNLPRFTLIGTSPRPERVPRDLLSCFPIVESMDAYNNDQLADIARQFANALKLEIDESAAARIARSSDGTPLDVLNRLRHIRDYAHIKYSSEKVSTDIATEALKLLSSVEFEKESNNGRQAIPSEVRREVWRRDEGKCVKCGSRENLEYDHIIPVAKGGSNTAHNIELLCENCNRSKSDNIQ